MTIHKAPVRVIRSRKGFTLIELLVVVLIIGILAAIAVPQYFGVIEKGHFAEATNCIDTVKGASERARLGGGGGYPSQASLATNPSTPLDTDCLGMKYFTGAVVGAAGGYVVTLTRNAQAFSTTSGASAGYTVVMTHADGAADAWSSNAAAGVAPWPWLPQ